MGSYGGRRPTAGIGPYSSILSLFFPLNFPIVNCFKGYIQEVLLGNVKDLFQLAEVLPKIWNKLANPVHVDSEGLDPEWRSLDEWIW